MNAEQENRIRDRLNGMYIAISKLEITIAKQNDRIKTLEQENEDLKGQLRQWGIDSAKFTDIRKKNSPENLKGLFLK